MRFRGGEFSTGTMGNFQPELTNLSNLFPGHNTRNAKNGTLAKVGHLVGTAFQPLCLANWKNRAPHSSHL
jgi:hypothetical protein